MPDMLVKLYELPPLAPIQQAMAADGVTIRPAKAPEKHLVLTWIGEHFSAAWASEADVAFSRQPISCWVAVQGNQILGFACYEATVRNFFGPTGVHPDVRGRGIGKALFLETLHAMKSLGYAYAVIGGAGPVEFYEKTVGAEVISGSVPGFYAGLLKPQDSQK